MNRFVAALVLPALLLACGGGSNPFDPDPVQVEPADPADPTGEEEENPVNAAGIPQSLANDLTRLNYDPATQTLTVSGLTLDEVPFTAVYRRRPGLDRVGYQAYTAQNDPLDRHVTAYVAEANNNSGVRAGVTVSGGPRNRFFGGGFYERDGAYTPPPVTASTGLVSYSGNYVGLINLGGSGEDLATVPAGTPSELIPSQAAEVTGRIFINADFADGSVEGNIIDREIVDASLTLPSVVLIQTPINDDGTFLGNIEYEQSDFPGEQVIGTDIGDYGGIFGGANASGVAGVVHLEEWDGPNDDLGFEGEEEYGVFVLDQCGQPVEDAAGCAGTNP